MKLIKWDDLVVFSVYCEVNSYIKIIIYKKYKYL